VVRSRACASLDDARAAARELGSPCVVKPPDRQDQQGLAVVEDEAALPRALERALEAARGSVVLVEEHVPGRELTVNAFLRRDRFYPLTVTDRVVAEPPAFGVALAHVWPSELRAGEIEDAVAVAGAAAKALGIGAGPTCAQLLLGPEGPLVVELAARLGGGHDAELCEAALGVDLHGLALAAALGESVSLSDLSGGQAPGHGRSGRAGGQTPGRGACVAFLVAPPGTLSSVEGLDSAERMAGIRWARAYREPGFAFDELRRGSDRAGAVLAVGESRAQAVKRARRAAGRIRFVTADSEALV
jgi:biotin carboxylase